MNKRIFVERKDNFQIERDQLQQELKHILQLELPSLRYFLVYDIFNVEDSYINQVIEEVFVENNKDIVLETLPIFSNVIAYESLPGQFDQRSNSAEQCIKLINPSSSVVVRSGIVITFDEMITKDSIQSLKNFLINAVESREKDLNVLSLPHSIIPDKVPTINNFINFSKSELNEFYNEFSFAMSLEDLAFVQNYFMEEGRNPSETELRVLDTYWSDHCRHTTFETNITNVSFDKKNGINEIIEETFKDYLATRIELNREHKPVTLMDIATINTKLEVANGNLTDLEVSDEINAASIYIDVIIGDQTEKWLLMFKNETHNHPTEIEPYGGASTCIGGAIRDPLSGRSYVYSAMRVTGAADITEPLTSTLEGKLPQRTISKEAAHGYSSYGNQIGLATTFVEEIHHQGYLAKRMEIGAVIGAAPLDHVRREKPLPNDVILLLGGRTGRDGIGGATGSSKAHTQDSIDESSAEVQKGNAPEERKLQRLFRNKNASKLIKKSNDFGAGGVSVAIGELADGLHIDLDKVPTKYDGINGTELAISESQERMAVVLDPNDVNEFIDYCNQENIEVNQVATVTDTSRLVMTWKGDTICDLKRSFIDTSGVRQNVDILVNQNDVSSILSKEVKGESLKEQITNLLKDQNIASKQGLEEMFDSSIGRTTVLSPYGGKYALTKSQTSCQLIPTRKPNTKTVSVMGYGFNPFISEISPYHGSTYAILDSMAKVVATGANYLNIHFTFQEYFQRLGKDATLWSKPLSALLGGYNTLKQFGLAAIGGKDSMSGTYHDIHVPPTLVSFAVSTAHLDNIISPEYKKEGSLLYIFKYDLDQHNLPSFEHLKSNFKTIHDLIQNKTILSAYAVGNGGITEAVSKCSFGNKIGVQIHTDLPLFDYMYGSIIVESKEEINHPNSVLLGVTTKDNTININNTIFGIDEAIQINQSRYLDIYPTHHQDHRTLALDKAQASKEFIHYPKAIDDVRVLIPVFPGTNCEYDSEDAFINAGANTKIVVFNNQNEENIAKSIQTLVEEINNAHIIMLSGGFSSGDEPDGSGKFIANVLRNKDVKHAIDHFLEKKHLILGICNGFQALVKSGLLPYGNVQPLKENAPTLFKNKINRHVAKFVNTKVTSTSSPWLTSFNKGDNHSIPMSHGEGRFIIDEAGYEELLHNDQIAFQYVDDTNTPTYNPIYNPNGSYYAIEGVISKNGLILGKMGHSERYQKGLFKNITGNKEQNIFQNAVDYFKKGDL